MEMQLATKIRMILSDCSFTFVLDLLWISLGLDL